MRRLILLSFSLVFLFTVSNLAYSDSLQGKIANVRMPFVLNEGQFPANVEYASKAFNGSVFVTKTSEVIYTINENVKAITDYKGRQDRSATTTVLVSEQFLGANKTFPSASIKTGTSVNYFTGTDSSRWKTGLSAYEVVEMSDIYDGIGLKLRAYGNNIEKIFTVSPGTDPSRIEIGLKGIDAIGIDKDGLLSAETGLGRVNFTKPIAYQYIDGSRRYVDVAYEIRSSNSYGFRVGDYDREHALIIDPLLASTFIGGGADDKIYAIATDSAGNVFVSGSTASTNFPVVAGGYKTARPGGLSDAFVAKFSKDLSTLIAMTFIGGSDSDDIFAMVLDASGNPYVAGQTYSLDFPITAGAYDTTGNGIGDAFISRLSNDLSTLIASTGLGGNSGDAIYSLATDKTGNIYATGYTASTNFPVTAGCYQATFAGKNDIFIVKFNSSLSTLSASTYFGGNDADSGEAISLDPSGNIYVAGITGSWVNFPVTGGAYDTSFGGNYDGFASRFSNDLKTLSASTFLGGSGYDYGYAMVLAPNSDVIVAGRTDSTDFPVTAGAYNTVKNGSMDIFVSRLDSALSSLTASTYLGGSNTDEAYALGLDTSGNIYVSGYTSSTNFPASANAYDKIMNGSSDAFLARLNPNLTSLPYASFLGGSGSEPLSIYSMAVDKSNIVYFAGVTPSTDFPTRAGYDITHNGANDGFISMFDPFLSSIAPAVDLTATPVSPSSMVLAWKDYNGTTSSGYKIERKPGTCKAGGAWSVIATVAPGMNTYTDTGRTALTSYSYRIRAYGTSGSSAYTTCVNATTAKAGTPAAPKGLTAIALTSNSVSLKWSDNSANETRFEVWRRIGIGAFTKLTDTIGQNVVTFSDTTASGNNATSQYSYYVKACNATGCSPASNVATVPFSPVTLQLNIKLPTQVSLKWVDKSGIETGYIVQRKTGACSSAAAWVTIAELVPDARGFSDTAVSSGAQYSYIVKAQAKSKQIPVAIGSSLKSNCISITIP